MTVVLGAYGPVEVVRGRLQGRIGYYDDDDTDERAVVYPGTPFISYELLPHAWLRPTDLPHLPTLTVALLSALG